MFGAARVFTDPGLSLSCRVRFALAGDCEAVLGQIGVLPHVRPAFSAQLPWRQYLFLHLPWLHRRRNPESVEAFLFRNAVPQYLLTKFRR